MVNDWDLLDHLHCAKEISNFVLYHSYLGIINSTRTNLPERNMNKDTRVSRDVLRVLNTVELW